MTVYDYRAALVEIERIAGEMCVERTRRTPTDAVKELKRLRARGAPVCGHMRLVASPAEWEEGIGRPVTDLRPGAATSPRDLMLDSTTPDAGLFRRLAAHALSLNDRTSTTKEQSLFAVLSVLTEVFTYIRASLRGPPNSLRLDDGIVEQLIATDLDGISATDMRLPFEAIFIELKETPIKLADSAGNLYPMKFMSILETFDPTGREWVTTGFGEPAPHLGATHGGPVHIHRIELRDDVIKSPAQDHATLGAEILGVRLAGAEYISAMRRLVANLMLYVSSPNPDIRLASGAGDRQAWLDALSATRTSPVVPRRKYGRTLWDVGATVKRLRVAIMDVLVRGHWRRQAHGAGRQLRKLIWIQPHVRMPTGAPAPGHDYTVKPDP